MGWKDWPSWLKGGVYGLLFYILGILCAIIFSDGDFFGSGFMIFSILTYLPSLLQFNNLILTFIWPFMFYFLMGSVIGLIVGKIKKK